MTSCPNAVHGLRLHVQSLMQQPLLATAQPLFFLVFLMLPRYSFCFVSSSPTNPTSSIWYDCLSGIPQFVADLFSETTNLNLTELDTVDSISIAKIKMVVNINYGSHVLKMLIGRGADVNAKTVAGETALMEAAANDDLRAVETLLKHHSDVHTKTSEGVTALHWAAEFGSPRMVSCLLDAGANATAKTPAGETPRHWAERNQQLEVATLLPPVGDNTSNSDSRQTSSGAIRAVLIGINSILPGNLSVVRNGKQEALDAKSFELRGCVNDVNSFESYLTDYMDVRPENIQKLVTCSQDGMCKRPTHDNIIDAIESANAATAVDDSVLIYYGGWTLPISTAYSALKGKNRVDTCFLPEDFMDGNKVIRDIELAGLIRAMTEKGVAVTVVLDVGTHRQMPDLAPVFRPQIPTLQPYQTVIQPLDAPISHAPGPLFEKTCHIFDQKGPNGSASSQGYTLFATANGMEMSSEQGVYHGAFTQALIKQLQIDAPVGSSCRTIFRRVIADANVPVTQPFLAGEDTRPFFGLGDKSMHYECEKLGREMNVKE